MEKRSQSASCLGNVSQNLIRTRKIQKVVKRIPNRSGNRISGVRSADQGGSNSELLPICIWEPHKLRVLQHRIQEYKRSPEKDKKILPEICKREQVRDVRALNTRTAQRRKRQTKVAQTVTLSDQNNHRLSPSACETTVCDGQAWL